MVISATKTNLEQKLIAAKATFKPVVFDMKSHHGAYASLGAIQTATFPSLHVEGLVIIQMPTVTFIEVKEGVKEAFFILTTKLIDSETKECIQFDYPMVLGTAQKQGSEITYAQRYSLCALLGVKGVPDTDGNDAASQEVTATPKSKKPTVDLVI